MNRPPSGRDPLQPFGQRQIPVAAPEQFSAPAGGGKLWWLFGAAVCVIALVLFIPSQLAPSRPAASPTPATTRAVAPASPRTATIPTNGIPFETDNAKGFWQINSSTWDSEGLTVIMTLRVDEGSLDFSFFCFDNTAAKTYDPHYPATRALRPSTLRAGQTTSGAVRFDVGRGPTTVILANGQGRQITALMVKP